ncbi:MAG: ATP-dependent Clp protease proteolytic subunit [Paludibacteraceae bacterium]
MIKVGIYRDIASDDERIFLKALGVEDAVFSAENVHTIFENNPEEEEFMFNINCNGGSVSEGLRIYDVLRTSGKTLYMNIEGTCHSMAIILLLAAPKENRTSNPNARALIHEVYTYVTDSMNADELRELADNIEKEQNAILDIYADRTGHDRTELQNLMKEEKVRTANELLKFGFISKINNYTTNFNDKTMSKKEKDVVLKEANSFLQKIKNLFSGEAVNYDFTDADGNVLFSTEKEDDSLQVGDVATPDGTFGLTDGRTVTIADGVVTEIAEADDDTDNSAERIEALENALKEAESVIENLRNQIQSNYKPANRSTKPQGGKVVKTAEELKNEAAEKRSKLRGGK